jgi:3-phosphoinositide dependent protein kinase-1
MRNGPRSRQGTLPLPAIVTSDPDFLPSRASSTPLPAHAPHIGLSPTTPRASHFADPDELDGQGPFRVTISSDAPHDLGHGNGNGNGNSYGYGSGSSSPRSSKGLPSPTIDRKGRTLSVGAGQGRDASRDRERRQSQASAKSAASGRVRETPRDYVFGEELGRGSYSTVSQRYRERIGEKLTAPGRASDQGFLFHCVTHFASSAQTVRYQDHQPGAPRAGEEDKVRHDRTRRARAAQRASILSGGSEWQQLTRPPARHLILFLWGLHGGGSAKSEEHSEHRQYHWCGCYSRKAG